MVPSIAVIPRVGSFALAFLWQDEKSPGFGLFGLRRTAEFRFETDLRSGFGHLPGIANRKQQAERGAWALLGWFNYVS